LTKPKNQTYTDNGFGKSKKLKEMVMFTRCIKGLFESGGDSGPKREKSNLSLDVGINEKSKRKGSDNNMTKWSSFSIAGGGGAGSQDKILKSGKPGGRKKYPESSLPKTPLKNFDFFVGKDFAEKSSERSLEVGPKMLRSKHVTNLSMGHGGSKAMKHLHKLSKL
jgi:hypothetical protein